MNIGNEAVEAAAKALYFILDGDHRGAQPPWESLDDDDEDKVESREIARAVLEAAAPAGDVQLVMTEAKFFDAIRAAKEYGWDHGVQAHADVVYRQVQLSLNPYRSQA